MPDEATFHEAMEVFNPLRREQVYIDTEGSWVIVNFRSKGTEYEYHVNLWSGSIVLATANPYEIIFENRRR